MRKVNLTIYNKRLDQQKLLKHLATLCKNKHQVKKTERKILGHILWLYLQYNSAK